MPSTTDAPLITAVGARVSDELANPGSPLFDAMLELIRRV